MKMKKWITVQGDDKVHVHTTGYGEVALHAQERGARGGAWTAFLNAEQLHKLCNALATAGVEIGAYLDNEATSDDGETLTPDERRRNDDLVANQAAREALSRRERLRKSMFADADEEEVDPVEVDEAEE
jgi:hypothetical protein